MRKFSRRSLLVLGGSGLLMAAISACNGGGGGAAALAGTSSSSSSSAGSTLVAPANFTFGASSADLCAGLTSLTPSSTPIAMDTSRPQPALGGSYTSNFGGKVIRITDVQKTTGKVGIQVPMYSTIPAWNADESYLILYQSQGFSSSGLNSAWLLYDGKTYQFIRELDLGAADVEDVYWSSTDPDILYYITDFGVPNGNYNPVLVQYNVKTDTKTVLHSFLSKLPVNNQNKVDFGHILYMNWANSLIGIREIVDGNTYSINTQSYNMATGQDNGWNAYSTASDYQGLQVAPSGKVAIIGSKVVDPVSQKILHTMSTDTEEHGSLGILANGDDAWISAQFDLSGSQNGNVIVEDLQTGAVTPIIGQANGWGYPPVTTHISTTAFRNQGWVGVSIVGNPTGQGLLDSTLLLANINTGAVCAAAHTHSNGSAPPQSGLQGYWAEPHVVISPSGTRLLFGSDWGNGQTLNGATESVDAYVVELPSYKG